jgi:hypothetical protein
MKMIDCCRVEIKGKKLNVIDIGSNEVILVLQLEETPNNGAYGISVQPPKKEAKYTLCGHIDYDI